MGVCCRLNNHISIISLHIFEFSSKSSGSIYYLCDCVVIFIERLSVFMNISKKPRDPFLAIFGTFSQKSSKINIKR